LAGQRDERVEASVPSALEDSSLGGEKVQGTLVVMTVEEGTGIAIGSVPVALRGRFDGNWNAIDWKRTDATGMATLAAVPGEYVLRCAYGARYDREVAVSNGRSTAEIKVSATTIICTVKDSAGNGLEGAQVWMSIEPFVSDRGGFVAVTGRDGVTLLRGVEDGRCISAYRHGYVMPVAVVYREKAMNDITIVLGNPGCRLSGVITDESLAPVSGAQVFVGWATGGQREGDALPMVPRTCSSDANGRFLIDDTPCGMEVPMWVVAPGKVVHTRLISTPADCTVRLDKGCRVYGSVRKELLRSGPLLLTVIEKCEYEWARGYRVPDMVCRAPISVESQEYEVLGVGAGEVIMDLVREGRLVYPRVTLQIHSEVELRCDF
jgi:metal-sulfur cluster biosynthetic enzyme